jgi:hypothetical protein
VLFTLHIIFTGQRSKCRRLQEEISKWNADTGSVLTESKNCKCKRKRCEDNANCRRRWCDVLEVERDGRLAREMEEDVAWGRRYLDRLL